MIFGRGVSIFCDKTQSMGLTGLLLSVYCDSAKYTYKFPQCSENIR